jgi:hypothetical protein
MGGVLGSVGQKVIAKQATAVTRDFMSSLERAVKGEAVGPAAPAAASKGGSGAAGGTSARPAGQSAAVPAAAASFDGESPAGIFVSYDFLRGTALGALLATLAILFLGARR